MAGAESHDLVTERRYHLAPLPETETEIDTSTAPALVGDRYELGDLLGSGGTARVYRARDRDAGTECAVKLFHRNAATLGPRRARETAILQGLDHPGVVGLHDAGEEDGRAYLVMQLVEGEDLSERLLTGPLGLDEIVAMARRLADALAHVHERGVIHRDLKPGNVLLGDDGAMITDFGVAYLLDTTRVTAVGSVAGTAAYMAPEQVLGEPVGPPADVYALGLVLIEAVTAEREYAGPRVEAALARLSRQPRIPEGLPDGFSQVLHLMTARDPALRPTAAEVVRALSEASSSEPLPSGLVTPPSLPASRRKRGVVAAAVLSPVAAGLVLVALVTGSGRVTDSLHSPSYPDPGRIPATSTAPPPSPVVILTPVGSDAVSPPGDGKAPSGGTVADVQAPPPSMTTVTSTATRGPHRGVRHHTPLKSHSTGKAVPPGWAAK
ncbi:MULTISPECIES: serine/threonine-protein kinase [unclassified Amycolatopsis]|uniref:serine/threonine-protein kinase n=1 Tax=unclassified Amycolatopsis TaxID=2618356 RepID=UPI002E24D485|nr:MULTISPECIES: protein kinase [unclassified Amycolatopsis]